MTRRVFWLAFLLFGLASATTLTIGQPINASFQFDSQKNLSSVFVYFPENWQSAESPSQFSCPFDWFKDADFNRRIHCACAAPCLSKLAEGKMLLSTAAPQAAGNYSWKIHGYSPEGSLSYNSTLSFEVQNPPRILVSFDAPQLFLAGKENAVNLTLSNGGQALLENVSLEFAFTKDGNNASSLFSVQTTSIPALAGGSRGSVLLKVTPLADDAIGGIVMGVAAKAVDSNNLNPVAAETTRIIQVRKPALLEVTLGTPSPMRASAGQRIFVAAKVDNRGQTAANNVNITLYSDGTAIASRQLSSVEGGGSITLPFDAVLRQSGTHGLVAKASYAEQLTGEQLSTEAPAVVSEIQAPVALGLQADAIALYSNEAKKVTVALRNTGEAPALDDSISVLKVVGGCELVGSAKQERDVLEKEVAVFDWTILAPSYGTQCTVFVQAVATDANSGDEVQSGVLQVPVAVTAKSTASFGSLKDSPLSFSMRDGQLFAKSSDPSYGWSIPLNNDSSVARLIALVEEVSRKQDSLEAQVRMLTLVADARASNVSGGAPVTAKVAVQLRKMPSPDASIDVIILAPSGAEAELFGKLAKDNGLQLGEAAALLKVDKIKIANKQEIASANVTFSVEKKWVDAHGGPEAMQAFRSDGDTLQVLNTQLAGSTPSDYLFLAESPDGLSLFALYSVERMKPQKPAEADSKTGLISSALQTQAYLAIVVVLAVALFFHLAKGGDRLRRTGGKGLADAGNGGRTPKTSDGTFEQ